MNGLLDGLPWNVSALGALVVLAAGFLANLDPWMALGRSSIAFAVFWLIGFVGRSLLVSSGSSSTDPAHSASVSTLEQHRSED